MDTKSQIVLGAFRALREDGLPALSYDRIAEEAGLSRQLIRYHFKSPDALMVAVCDHLAGLYRDRLIANAKSLEGPSRIEMFLDFYFGLLDGDGAKPEDDQVYDALFSLATCSDEIRVNLLNQYSLLGQVLSHELQLSYPALQRRAADELSFVFVSLMYGHWKMVASLGVSPDHNRLTRDALARLIRAFIAEDAPLTEGFAVWSKDSAR